MHCKSCEIRLEKAISELEWIKKVTATHSRWQVEISYDWNLPDSRKIQTIIEENGYKIWAENPLPWYSRDIDDYFEIISISAIIFVIYFFFQLFHFSFPTFLNLESPSLMISFLVWLTAGVSSCMALIGGLVLGISASWNQEHTNASFSKKLEPHFYFNLGRILWFGFLWWLLGLFWSFISLSSTFLAMMTLVVALVMILLGIKLVGISPRIAQFSITLPKFIGKYVWISSIPTRMWAMLSWVATFFLPCGFTFAMQLYAINSGDFIVGALVMMLFALWTVPGLLGIGGITASMKGAWAKRFFRFTGVIIIFLAIFNISNATNLFSLWSYTPPEVKNTNSWSLQVQEIRMIQDDSGYTPSIIPIKPNHVIKLIIEGKSPYNCSSAFIIPSMKISKRLIQWENTIEFVSPASGEVRFSCSMGMYTGKFMISEDSSTPQSNTLISKQDNIVQNPSWRNNGYCPMINN